MSVAELDEARQEAFAGRMVQVLNDACLGLMTGLGHESGLFDVMAGLEPATSEEIARAAGLSERYVREWLGAGARGVADPGGRPQQPGEERGPALTPHRTAPGHAVGS